MIFSLTKFLRDMPKHFLIGEVWGTVPSVGNVAQPPLGKASGERGSVGRIGSPVANQACIVPRPVWDLLLLKLPHPELRQQTFVYCVSSK